ncbi:MAG: GAP family protein [Acidimicrobiales bacterium]|nr:GAP family protein [Acidimicrobiales bacterium]MCB9402728.1 GAP family protein [Microthrixaceae bacterium]
MLTQAIGDLLPTAVGVALSPVPIIAVILMLGTPRAKSNGPAFAIGWIAGLVIVSVAVLAVAGGADDPDSATATGVNWFQVAVGVLFLVMAAGQWRKRPRQGQEPVMPKWMAMIDTFTAGKSVGLGALLSGVNPKNLALTAASAASIAQAGLSTGQSAIAVAVFVLIGSITVAGPVLLYLGATDKATGPLAAIKEFMSAHNAVIMMIVLLVLGAKILGQGIGAMSN